MKEGLHVLLADDDDVFAMLVQKALASVRPARGACTLSRVKDGGEALDYLRGEPPWQDRTAHPLPDLILLDQRMTRMDGSEALAEIKGDPALAGTPVGILSTSDQERLRTSCYAKGASFYIRKPLGYDELREKLRLLVRFFDEVLEIA